MIYINNRQRKIPFSVRKTTHQIQVILQALNYTHFDVSVLITTNSTIRKYNKLYRNKDIATDVLSFPYHTDARPGKKIVPLTKEDQNLGDIIISLEYVYRDALRFGTSGSERLRIIIVHGICHLLGYDHIRDADYKIMHAQELGLLKKLEGL